uniref:Trehalase n=1 Tax=Artemia franciscana TaxID=6661 RepID=D2YY86_ARTSF|nr:trehalase [Artemia franciscana]
MCAFLSFFVVFGFATTVSCRGDLVLSERAKQLPPVCASEIYCHGTFLHTIQMAGLFRDSKTFVDKKLKINPEEVLASFEVLMNSTDQNPSRDQLAAFINLHFEPEGSEFEEWDPIDWHSNPSFLDGIRDTNLKIWGNSLHEAWTWLGRKIRDDVRINPQLYSMMYLPNPFIIPGGRFRETYYWDSYWIIKGLLISGMHETVKGMLLNFLLMVDTIGLVPNGGRIYYEKRSQPPLLTPMVELYVNATGDIEFLKQNIHLLEKEMDFWLQERTVNVDGHRLIRYDVKVGGPRPESYKEDIEAIHHNPDLEAQLDFYMNIAAGAETGWDFSSRWYWNGDIQTNLSHVRTRDILPVDLNSFIAWDFDIMSRFEKQLGRDNASVVYSDLYSEWKTSINAILWDDEAGSWFDYDSAHRRWNTNFYVSNLTPLFVGCYDPKTVHHEDVATRVLDYLEKSNALKFPGGVPTSLMQTSQQWDFPNGWPPLQHMLVMGLDKTGDPRAKELAFDVAQRWVFNNYEAFTQSLPNAMFEKYDVTVVGLPGGGGEYDVQLGFGWTNGVVMDFLIKYGERLTSVRDAKQLIWSPSSVSVGVGAGATFLGAWIGLASTRFYRQLFKSDHKMGGIHGVAEAIQGLIACVGSLLVATAALFSEKDTTKRPTSGQTPQSSPIRRTKSLPGFLLFQRGSKGDEEHLLRNRAISEECSYSSIEE